ncbi:MAG: hypothetical protein NC081_04700 [Roseburia sp.]|nr:hypothetical protein [Roseburia sp.]
MRSDNRDKAMRIFEALSGVDSELLERSEKSSKRAATIPVRWSRALAACFCLIVLGALAGGVYRMKFAEGGMNQSSSSAGGASLMQEQAAMYEAAPENENGAGGASWGDDTMPEDTTTDRTDVTGDGGSYDMAQRQSGFAEASGEIEDLGSCLAGEGEKLVLEEARAVEFLGGYVPEQVPEGYIFENAILHYDSDLQENISLSVCWTKGLDDIFLSIRRVDVDSVFAAHTGQLRMADVEEPETYDVSLYEIPYAETVPEEYREVFDHPVFLAADLTPELIQSRMKIIVDAGDTETPSGRFGVLYGDVLVEFNGDLPPEQVWELFCQME